MTDPLTPGTPEPTQPSGLKPGWERDTMERLVFATLQEQRAARRWRTFTRLAWLAFLLFVVWTVIYRGAPKADKSLPHSAVVEVKGEIASDSDASAEFIVSAMRAA